MKRLFVIALFLAFANARSQSAFLEYKKTIDAYKNANQFAFDVDVYAYEKKTDKKAQLVGTGKAKKKDASFYSRFMEQEVLYGPKVTLMINHDKKTIEYFEYDYAKKQKDLKIDLSSLTDSLLVKSDSLFTYHGLSEGRKHFSISSKGQVIEQTDIFVNPSNNLISKVIYYYGESTEDYELGVSTVVIYYKNVVMNNVTGENFDVNHYVSQQGTSYVATSNYKGYKVILHKTKKSI